MVIFVVLRFGVSSRCLGKLSAFMRCQVILRQTASFCSNDQLAFAGDDEGNTNVSNPASANAASSFPEVLPLKQTRFNFGQRSLSGAKSLCCALRIALSKLPLRSHAAIASHKPTFFANNALSRSA
jgi:hypothetical protein